MYVLTLQLTEISEKTLDQEDYNWYNEPFAVLQLLH